MKVALMSDIHLDNLYATTKYNGLPDLIEHIKGLKVEIVVISGDISGDYKTTLNIVTKLNKETGKKVYFNIGNHDIWTTKEKTNPNTSLEAYNHLKESEYCIENKIIHLDNETVLIGNMGWYDYSLCTVNIDEFVIATKKKQFSDYKFVHWSMTDKEFCEKQLEQLSLLLENESLKGKTILLSMHFIPLEQMVHYSDFDLSWNINNSFFGSSKFGDIILNSEQHIKYVHFGHTHKKKGIVIEDTSFICNPIGYSFEWSKNTFKEQLEFTTEIVDLKS